MADKPIPRYYGLRIYLTSSILFLMLVFPFMIYLGLQNLPRLVDREGMFHGPSVVTDTTGLVPSGQPVETIGNTGLNIQDTTGPADNRGNLITLSEGDSEISAFDNKGPFGKFFLWFFPLSLAAYLAGLIYAWQFKRYFRRRRKQKEVSPALHDWCKKHLLGSPFWNALIIILPNCILILYDVRYLFSGPGGTGDPERKLFVYFWMLTFLATMLEFLFAYYWQKHRVHMKYIDHLYTESELRQRVFRHSKGRIRDRYLVASGITTLLPLLIVLGYLVLSITPVKELGMDSLSKEQKEILIGPWGNVIKPEEGETEIGNFKWMFYVNAGDSLLMIAGIGSGVLVAFIYLILLVRWTNQDITRPVRELLLRMHNTRGGGTQQYAVVRTNDEIGELAEGYNEMTRQIYQHLERIRKMNRDLETKVEDRTKEVVMQKEEIQAQKEEIQAQLDLTTEQMDTISRQKEQILDSIRYAQKIQAALLPPLWYLSGSVSDHFILFKPRDIVSGDYYWTAFREGKLLIAVADCTGHGVPGAFLSILGISSMNEIINRPGSLHASEILEQLRDFLIHTLHRTGEKGEAQDGIEIALCIIDPVTRKMEFAGANRPLYMIKAETPMKQSAKKQGKGRKTRKTGTGPEVIQVRGDRMPIGIYEQDLTPFTPHEMELGKGDTLYLFSDGYVDQLGGPRRKTFRSVHFRNLLLGIQDKNMDEQKKILWDRHEAWKGEIEQIDDILVVGIRL